MATETERDPEIMAAQERLLLKRQDRGVMESPIRSTTSSDLTEIIGRCRKKSKELQDSGVIVFPVQEEHERPRSTLSYCGVDRKYQACRFENFQGGERLKGALRQLLASGESIVLCGNTGSGKTHLSVAMLAEWLRTKNTTDALFVTLPDMLLEIRDSFSDKSPRTEKELVDLYASRLFLVLDDLGAEKPTEFTVATLSLILDRRIRQERQTIITTNLTIDEIEDYTNARIASRISEMKNVTVNMPDWRKRRGNHAQ